MQGRGARLISYSRVSADLRSHSRDGRPVAPSAWQGGKALTLALDVPSRDGLRGGSLILFAGF